LVATMLWLAKQSLHKLEYGGRKVAKTS